MDLESAFEHARIAVPPYERVDYWSMVSTCSGTAKLCRDLGGEIIDKGHIRELEAVPR
jgi:hypothetical protein